MTFLSILTALLLERIMPQLLELRRFEWLDGFARWMDEVLHAGRMGAWAALILLLSPLLLLTWILASMFENALFGLFELAFNVLIVFACLGPRELDRQVDDYIDALEMGDEQRRSSAASRLTGQEPANDLAGQALQVCQSLYVEANGRIFAVLFWFAVAGPVAAVMYRLLEQFLSRKILDTAVTGLDSSVRLLLGVLDWPATRITLFAFMLSGSFEDGFKTYRDGSPGAVDLREQNHELLQRVGCSCIVSNDVQNSAQAIEMIRKSRGLVLRSVVVWLLLILFVGWFA